MPNRLLGPTVEVLASSDRVTIRTPAMVRFRPSIQRRGQRRGPTQAGQARVIELPVTASRRLTAYRLDDLAGGA